MAQSTSQRISRIKTRTVSSNDAKQHWGSMMQAASDGEAVIVESHGRPRAVVISPEVFEELQEAREQQRQAGALKMLTEIEARYDGRNDDLSDVQITEIAVREGRAIKRAVADRLHRRMQRTE